MVIHLDLTTVPEACWWWTGAISYCLLCYLVLAPVITRKKCTPPEGYAWYHAEWDKMMGFLFWVGSPVVLPFYYVFFTLNSPFNRLLFGSSK